MKYETNLNGNKPKTIKSLILDEKGNPLPLREEPKRDWLTGWVSKKFPKHQTGKKIEYTINAKDRLFKQIASESSFNKYAKSGANALGPAQIRKELYMDYVKDTKDTEPYESVMDPEKALKVRNWAITRFQNAPWNTPKKGQTPINKLAKAYAAYNWGPGSLVEYLNKVKKNGEDIYKDTTWIHSLPPETKNYLDRILFDDDPKFLKDLEQFKSKPNDVAKFFMNVKLENGGRIPKHQTGNRFINAAIAKYNSPEEQSKRKFIEDNRRASKISGRVDYSEIDPITDILVPFGTIQKMVTKNMASKLGKEFISSIGKTDLPKIPLNVGWAPKQKFSGWFSSHTPVEKWTFPNYQNWAHVTHNAPADIIYFTGKKPEPQSFLNKRPIKTQYDVELNKPMVQVGEVPSVAGKKNIDRNEILRFAQRNNSDGVIFQGIKDNQMVDNILANFSDKNITLK